MASNGKNNCANCAHAIFYSVLLIAIVVLSVFLYLSLNPGEPTLPRLSNNPDVKNVTTSAIEIEWNGAYDGDGPVCGYIVNLNSPSSISWSNVGFVSVEEEDVYGFTIDRLDANTVYEIAVTVLHCSGREGERSSEISQSTDDHAPRTESPSDPTYTVPPCPVQNCTECPTDVPTEDDDFWKRTFLIVVPTLSSVILLILLLIISCCVCKLRGKKAHEVVNKPGIDPRGGSSENVPMEHKV